MDYRVTNEVNHMVFQNSNLVSAQWQDGTLSLSFARAVVVGHSCPELEDRIPCTLNPGEDRCASPKLNVVFSGCRILGICRERNWFGNKSQPVKEFLTEDQFDDFWSGLDGWIGVYELRHHPEADFYQLCFYCLSLDRYRVTFTAKNDTESWERFGNVDPFILDYRIRKANQQARGDTMVYGAIDEKSFRWYTCMAEVFRAIGNAQLDYNWLITDCVCYPKDPQFDRLLSQESCWLTGRELTDMVEQEDFQWIWAVLSGFEPDVTQEEALRYPLPYADGYSGFWHNPIALQHPLAQVEIVPWDSGLVLILSKKEKLVSDFRAALPRSQDLSQYNER